MSTNPFTANKRTAICKPVFRYVGLLLLCVFIGRVALVSMHGYAGVPKMGVSTLSNSAEEKDDDKKDENKYTDHQFKCIEQSNFLLLVPIYTFLSKPFCNFKTGFVAVHALTVLTPPPNC